MKHRAASAVSGAVALAAVMLPTWRGVAAEDDRSLAKVVFAERRVALVVGNAAYEAAPLRNAVNDARDMAELLRSRRFQVRLLTDASRRGIEDAVHAFGADMRRGGVGLFYYAGHGVQVEGRNYLIPVGAAIAAARDVPFEAVDVGRVLAEMEASGNRLNLVILDACRDNPFPSESRSLAGGLAGVQAPRGTVVAYATSPGKVAKDGPDGRNGVYTRNLLLEMAVPGQELGDMFKAVRARVVDETGGQQTPWESTSVMGDFYFTPVDLLDARAVEAARQQARLRQAASERAQTQALIAQLDQARRDEEARVEREIAGLEERLGQAGAGGDTLDGLHALMRQRARLRDELDALRRKAVEDRQRRDGEIVLLGRMERESRRAVFEADRAKYRELAQSGLMRPGELGLAWTNLCARWGATNALGAPVDLVWNDAEGRAVGTSGNGGPKRTLLLNLGGDGGTGVTMQLVWVPPGDFVMGSAEGEAGGGSDETPAHRVVLTRGFWMGRGEVTQRQWRQVMGANPACFTNAGPDAPVENVSWEECQSFLHRLNHIGAGTPDLPPDVLPERPARVEKGSPIPIALRLPTEAEWEYACRAGSPARFSGTDRDDELARLAWYQANSTGVTHAVGQSIPNAFGLCDMHGNVWEWCADGYEARYPAAGVTDPAGPPRGETRALRGGSFRSDAASCRSANRGDARPDVRACDIGLRVAGW